MEKYRTLCPYYTCEDLYHYFRTLFSSVQAKFKAHTQRAKPEAKANFFFDVCRLLFEFFVCLTFDHFQFATIFARCEYALIWYVNAAIHTDPSHQKQECIPVGCVPTGVCLEGVCREGDLPRGGLPRGVSASREGGSAISPPWTDGRFWKNYLPLRLIMICHLQLIASFFSHSFSSYWHKTTPRVLPSLPRTGTRTWSTRWR